MRVDRLFWLAVVVSSGACVNGLPYGLEPLPADEDDTYEPVVTAPDCRPNNDGVIERDEMPFVVGAVAQHLADLLLGGGDPGARSVGEHDRCRRLVDAGGGGAAGLCRCLGR